MLFGPDLMSDFAFKFIVTILTNLVNLSLTTVMQTTHVLVSSLANHTL